MAFDDLRDGLVRRLDEGGRGDRAWWLVTRVHVSAARLRAIAQYIYDAAGSGVLTLTADHYRQLAAGLDIVGADPGQTINRHYFLTMDNPLGLIERVNGASWTKIRLTLTGLRLATDPDTPSVFEDVLDRIRFCREPWYSSDRAAQYAEFDVGVYRTTIDLLGLVGGYITTDEFDLFLSRVRTAEEMPFAAAAILEYRSVTVAQQKQLLKLVADRTPGTAANPKKTYQNWRDMGRHTFALLALGQSLNQVGSILRLAQTLVTPISLPATAPNEAAAADGGGTVKPPSRKEELSDNQRPQLKLPHAAPSAELLTPPVMPLDNSGAEAELLIGKMLASSGWQVVYCTNRRGFGFDLWAKKGADTFVIEVKSSVSTFSSVTLTPTEFAAALHHGENYLLVLVERIGSAEMLIHAVSNPAKSLASTKVLQTSFVFSGSDCRNAAGYGAVNIGLPTKH